MDIYDIINRLYKNNSATGEELLFILDNIDDDSKKYLIEKSHLTRMRTYGDKVYTRGLIEFTNYCVRNCRYCGIRADNIKSDRYRLTLEDILECADLGDKLGYKTYVLQGGEDPYYTDEVMIEIIYR